MERRKRVDTYQFNLICEICPGGTGKMLPTGEVYTCNPPLYARQCVQCGAAVKRRIKYPYVDYVVRD